MDNKQQQVYERLLKPYTEILNDYKKQSDELLLDRSKNSPHYIAKTFHLADIQLKSIFLLLADNHLSQRFLATRNARALHEARHICYQCLLYYEDILGNELNPPFTDLKDMQQMLSCFEDNERYRIALRIGFTINVLKANVADSAKMRWYFIDFDARYAIIARNLLDVVKLSAGFSPGEKYYRERIQHSHLIQKVFRKVSMALRKKYETTSREIIDFRRAIDTLNALQSFYRLGGMVEEEQSLQREVNIWKSKLTKDM